MHGFPDDFDRCLFVGQLLQTVSFGPFIIHLSFSDVHVGMEASYEHRGPEDEGWTDRASVPPATSRLMQLTNHTVTDAEFLDRRQLRLAFDHGHALTLIDDNDQYESFQISNSEDYWVI